MARRGMADAPVLGAPAAVLAQPDVWVVFLPLLVLADRQAARVGLVVAQHPHGPRRRPVRDRRRGRSPSSCGASASSVSRDREWVTIERRGRPSTCTPPSATGSPTSPTSLPPGAPDARSRCRPGLRPRRCGPTWSGPRPCSGRSGHAGGGGARRSAAALRSTARLETARDQAVSIATSIGLRQPTASRLDWASGRRDRTEARPGDWDRLRLGAVMVEKLVGDLADPRLAAFHTALVDHVVAAHRPRDRRGPAEPRRAQAAPARAGHRRGQAPPARPGEPLPALPARQPDARPPRRPARPRGQRCGVGAERAGARRRGGNGEPDEHDRKVFALVGDVLDGCAPCTTSCASRPSWCSRSPSGWPRRTRWRAAVAGQRRGRAGPSPGGGPPLGDGPRADRQDRAASTAAPASEPHRPPHGPIERVPVAFGAWPATPSS